MWILMLNDMRASNIENVFPICRAESYNCLLALVDREKVEPYRDGMWHKSFRAGGSLEWYNPPYTFSRESFVDVGTRDDWMREAGANYDQKVILLLSVDNV